LGIKERKEREKKIRIQQIMDAAKMVFSAKGFRIATMEEIAQKAELSPGTLYSYFKSKDDLYASLNIKMLKYLNENIEDLDKNETLTAGQKIETMERVFYDLYRLEPLLIRNLLQLQASKELWNLSEEVFEEIKTLSREGFRIIAKIFEDGISEGTFLPNHPVALADIIWSIFSGLLLWEESKIMSGSRENHFISTLHTAFEIILRGIRRQSQ
jgi:AcrR family transcriptional regulator